MRFLPALVWTIISYVLLTLPGSDIPSMAFLDLIYFDKWVHIGMFGILNFLWCYSFRTRHISDPWLSIVVSCTSLLYGIIMEFVQKYYANARSFDMADIMADAIGCLFGYGLFRFIIGRSKVTEKNKPL